MLWMLCVHTVGTIRKRIMIRRYSELIKLQTFEERFDYLKLQGIVGESTFGFDRYLNQMLYTSKRWRSVRDKVIIRDNACDLAMDDYDIYDMIIVHHMNPITVEDIEQDHDDIYNLEYLICTTQRTHNAIHYGNSDLLPRLPKERRPGDTSLW